MNWQLCCADLTCIQHVLVFHVTLFVELGVILVYSGLVCSIRSVLLLVAVYPSLHSFTLFQSLVCGSARMFTCRLKKDLGFLSII